MSGTATTGAAGSSTAAATPASGPTTLGPVMVGARLYDRRLSIQVYDASGKGLDLSALRCTFAIRQFELATPNNMELRIINLSAATSARMKKEFTRVQVSAGYEGQYGIIFDGVIIWTQRGRDSPADTYCLIVAADGDEAHNKAIVNTTMAAGSTQADIQKVCLTAFNQYGVEQGFADPALAATPALPRGKVLFGLARDTMHDVANTTGTNWSIQNGRLQVVSRTGYLPNEAVVLNAETGLIGLPTIQPNGIRIRCLLNPLLRINTLLRLNNASIQQQAQAPGPTGEVQQQLLPKIEGDGTYKILAVDHFGDTRGNEWYSEIQALAVSQGSTRASALQSRGFDPVVPLGDTPTGAAVPDPTQPTTDGTAPVTPVTATPLAPLPTQPNPAAPPDRTVPILLN